MKKEDILTLLVIELVKRLSDGNDEPIVVTNTDLNKLIEDFSEVDFSGSDESQFVLKFVEHNLPQFDSEEQLKAQVIEGNFTEE